MYEEFFGHFGLQRNPFHVSPNPKAYYSTPVHDEALKQLVFGVEARQGLMVLTGEPGTGKSTILHYFLEWLRMQKYSTAYIFQTLVPSLDLLWLILRDFGVKCDSQRKSDLLLAIKDWLMARHNAGDCPVIVIDEAQGLTSRGLDELRMLLNLEFPGGKLVQVVLAGQPQLEEKLRWHKLAQLRQRVMCHARLRPLTLEETAGFIRTRLSGAGGERAVVFPQETIDEIYSYSKGIPRVIHLLCEHALLNTYAHRRDSVTTDDILHVARQFELIALTPEEVDAFRSDTFCRLIPFPKLMDDDEPLTAQWPKAGASKLSPDPSVSALESLVDLATGTTAPPVPVVPKWPAKPTEGAITAPPSDVTARATAPVVPVAPEKTPVTEWPTEPAVSAIESLVDIATGTAEPSIPVSPKWPTKPTVEAIAAPLADVVAGPTAPEVSMAPRKPLVTEIPKTKAAVATTSAPVQPMRVSLAPARPATAETKIPTTKPPVTERPTPVGFMAYWRAVGQSLASDVRQLVQQCFGIGRPLPKKSIARQRPRPTATSISKWLRMPFSSQQASDRSRLPANSRRVSSASPKHF